VLLLKRAHVKRLGEKRKFQSLLRVGYFGRELILKRAILKRRKGQKKGLARSEAWSF